VLVGSACVAAALAADWVEYCNAPYDGSNPNGGTDWAAQRAADGSPDPYYLGEYNVPGPTNSLQISLASGLFIAKVLGTIAESGWAAASLWDVLNGYDSPRAHTARGITASFRRANPASLT
jgi:hypothetical protein